MWGAIISGALGLAKMGYGIAQKNKARQDAKNNVMPPYEISSLYGDTLGVATQEAGYGFSPQALNAFTQTSQQNLAGASENILRGGGDINDISKLYGADNNARKAFAIEDDKLRATKLQGYFDQSAQMAGQQAIQWRLNYFDRWKDRAAAAASLLQNSNSIISSGINALGSAAGQFASMSSKDRKPKDSDVEKPYNYMDNGTQVENSNNYMNWFGQNQWNTPSLSDPNNINPNLVIT
jgi:hypothetical protein